MADFEDMNATPLGKLPMPAVQSKADAPRMDGGSMPSYADMLKELSMPQQQAPAQTPQQQPAFQQPAFQQPSFQQPSFQQPAFQQPAFQQPAYAAPESPMHHPPGAHRYRGRYREPPGRRRGDGFVARLRAYKSSLLITLVVFLVLMYVAPKLAQLVPQLLTPVGKFNAMGLLIIAAGSGGIHRVLDHHVKF